MLSTPDYPVFTPNKMANVKSLGDAGAMNLTASTIKTERQKQMLTKAGWESGPRNLNQGTQVTHGTTF